MCTAKCQGLLKPCFVTSMEWGTNFFNTKKILRTADSLEKCKRLADLLKLSLTELQCILICAKSLPNATNFFVKYSCLLAWGEVLSTIKCFDYAFKNGKCVNIHLYGFCGLWWTLRVLMPGCRLHFDCRVSPCLPPLCLSLVWTVIWRHWRAASRRLSNSELFPCMYNAEQDAVGGVSSLSVHYMIELSEVSHSKKMSNTSIYGAVKRCRRLNLDCFSS